MKSNIIAKLLFITLLIGLFEIQSQAQISVQDATSVLKRYMNEVNINTKSFIYVYKSIVSESQKMSNIKNEYVTGPTFKSWLFFIDEIPNANWEHNCRYIYINIIDSSIYEIKSLIPPQHLENWQMLSKLPTINSTESTINSSLGEDSNIIQSPTQPLIADPQHSYAILISGGADSYNNWVRYWNDCSFMFKTLRNHYSLPQSHIYVLMSDGTNPANDRHLNSGSYDSSPLDLNNDGVNDIQYAATTANLATVFNQLSNILTCNDFLFIYTTDHGGTNGGNSVYMYLWGQIISDADFATLVNTVHPGSMNITMEQCYSGGFIDNLSANNRVIATACTATQVSHATQNSNYNEFVYHWTAAVNGSYPAGTSANADNNSDGYVSMSEAFTFAYNHDAFISSETPQYNSNYSLLGQNLTLLGNQFCTTKITGSRLVCSSNTGYSVTNLFPGDTLVWSNSSNLTPVSGQNTNNYVVRSNGVGSGYINTSIKHGCGLQPLASYDVWVGPPSVTVTGDATSDCTNTTHYFTATQTSYYANPTSFSWNLVPLNGNTVSPYGYQNSQCAITFYNPYSASGYTVQARATNSCGTGSYGSTSIYIHTCLTFLLSPNPASETVTVTKQISGASQIESSAALSEDASTIYTIRIINYYGSLQYTTTRSGDSFTIPINTLKDGQYIVQFINGTDVYNSQLIVKH